MKSKQKIGYKEFLEFSGITNHNFISNFNSWNEFKKMIDEECSNNFYTDEELLDFIKQTYKELYYAPNGVDVQRKFGIYNSTYKRRFGSFRNAVILAGIDPDKYLLTEDDIEQEYIKLKSELNRIPKKNEFNLPIQNAINRLFGNYIKLIKYIGDEKKPITKRQYQEAYKKLWKYLDEQPTIHEFRKVISVHNLDKVFGSWDDFLKSVGADYHINYTKEELISEYYKRKKDLGRQPKMKDFKNYSPSIKKFIKAYGTWNNFLLQLGEPLLMSSKTTKIPRKLYVDNYKQLTKKLGRQPTCQEIIVKNGSKIGIGSYITEFGSWTKFIEYIGDTPRILNIPDEDIIE